MSRPALTTMAAAALLAIAACSPGAEASGSAGATGTCSDSAADGGLVRIIDFAFGPEKVSAKPNEVIGFTNMGSAPHTATLDGGDCATPTLNTGDSAGLAFSAPGTYPFHCSIHPAMKGTIVIS